MYPQTHIFFAEKVFGSISDALALGSIFPDLAMRFCSTRQDSHGRGAELLAFFSQDKDFLNFAEGVITHGIYPKGIDYYGDEKYLSFERGYCFEKGRSLIEETIRGCNLPPEMGWWKSHNIIEMGIELNIGHLGPYNEILTQALSNKSLIKKISEPVAQFYNFDPNTFYRYVESFANYIDTSRVCAQSLALHYELQMQVKHHIQINTKHVANLILKAAKIVEEDFHDFLDYALKEVQKTITEISRQKI